MKKTTLNGIGFPYLVRTLVSSMYPLNMRG
jgi:hypothetical protein